MVKFKFQQTKSILQDEEVLDCLNNLHQKFVVVPIDKILGLAGLKNFRTRGFQCWELFCLVVIFVGGGGGGGEYPITCYGQQQISGKWLKKLSPVNKSLLVHALCYPGSGTHLQRKV